MGGLGGRRRGGKKAKTRRVFHTAAPLLWKKRRQKTGQKAAGKKAVRARRTPAPKQLKQPKAVPIQVEVVAERKGFIEIIIDTAAWALEKIWENREAIINIVGPIIQATVEARTKSPSRGTKPRLRS